MYDKEKMYSLPHHILFGCSELPGHCRVGGLSVRAAFSEKSIDAAREFDFTSEDVIVAAYPRAGSTLVQGIVYQLQYRPQRPYQENITERVPCLEYHGRATCLTPTGVRKAQNLTQPRIMNTHLPARFLNRALDSGSRVVYLMRNPKDVCASYYEFYKGSRLWGNWNFGTFQHLFFNTDKLGFGNVFDHCLEFWQERARPNVLIIFYEDLLRNKNREVTKIAKFLGNKLDSNEIEKINEMTSYESIKNDKNMDPLVYERNTAQVRLDYDFYTRGSVGYWRQYFTTMPDRQYDDVIRARMTSEGIYFNYGKKVVENGGGNLSLCGQCGAKLDEKCKKENSYNTACYFKTIDY